MLPKEIILPITTPETEWVRGRPLQKVSPTRDHGRLQMKLASLLDAWTQGRGEVATEWRFRVAPPGEDRRPLVPDIAYVSAEQLRGHSDEEIQAPAFAPTVAIEVLSPRDNLADVESKVDVYLRSGAALVIVVDSARRTIRLRTSAAGMEFAQADTVEHPVLPGFALPVGAFFAAALDRTP